MRAGAGQTESPWDDLRGGFVLGGARFLDRVRTHFADAAAETPKRQRTLARPALAALRKKHPERGAWMTEAHNAHGYTLAEIAAVAGLHYSSISRIIAAWRDDGNAR